MQFLILTVVYTYHWESVHRIFEGNACWGAGQSVGRVVNPEVVVALADECMETAMHTTWVNPSEMLSSPTMRASDPRLLLLMGWPSSSDGGRRASIWWWGYSASVRRPPCLLTIIVQ